MAMLLNRKYGSRLECLYYILQSCYAKYGINKFFSLKDLKYSEEDKFNTHNFCNLLIDCVGIKCCPYLVNPLNSSKCYATQSVISDTTKSKAVSDIGGSLEALGFIKRYKTKFKVTLLGEKWIQSDFYSNDWEDIARLGVLSYGPVIGFLFKLKNLEDTFSYSGIYLSYPQTEESVVYTDEHGNKKIVNLSTDSQKDSNTRTLSRIIGWCVSVGLIEPCGIKIEDNACAHLKYRDFVNSGELVVRKFKKTELYYSLFNEKQFISNPLSYTRLHKNVGSLRENGGEDLRRATLEYNRNIINRRFVFVYILNHFSKENKNLSFKLLVQKMIKYRQYFFTELSNPAQIMSTEIEIAFIAGIPFYVTDGDNICPCTIINDEVLLEDVDETILSLANKIIEEMEQ